MIAQHWHLDPSRFFAPHFTRCERGGFAAFESTRFAESIGFPRPARR